MDDAVTVDTEMTSTARAVMIGMTAISGVVDDLTSDTDGETTMMMMTTGMTNIIRDNVIA